jgi:hypothetical protein
VTGIPEVSAKALLSGAAKGASATSDFSAGFAASLSEDWNTCVPAISRDATADIADGLTDASSTYDIDAILAALTTHLSLRGTIKNRREAQAMCGHRDSTIQNSYDVSNATASELIQLCVEDVLVFDPDSDDLVWKFPHVQAGLMAGIRLGTEIGEPLTSKLLNCNGIGHVVSSVTGLSTGDFNPALDYDVAIDNGVLFAERIRGGISIVVDNTTYGRDQNFVFNRGSVMEASHEIARRLRARGGLFTGSKTVVGLRASIEAALEDELDGMQDDAILGTSDDAVRGWKNLRVTISGNTTSVRVHAKPIQGQEFMLIEIELGDTSSTI